MRDFIEICMWIVAVAIVGMMFMQYDSSASVQEESIRLMNSAVRTSALANVDHSSRVREGEVFIIKEDFEENAVKQLEESDINILSDDATIEFEYLEHDNGAIKAVRMLVNSHNKDYQATAVVDIAE